MPTFSNSVFLTGCDTQLLTGCRFLTKPISLYRPQVFEIQFPFSALGWGAPLWLRFITWQLCVFLLDRCRPSMSPTALRQRSARSRRPRRSRPRCRNREELLSENCSQPSSDRLSLFSGPFTLCAVLMFVSVCVWMLHVCQTVVVLSQTQARNPTRADH